MLVPVVSKILNSTDVLLERVLPVSGDVTIQTGTKVQPFDHLGACTFSQKTLKFSDKFRPKNLKRDGQFYYFKSHLGREGRLKCDAPYNGNLFKLENGSYEFREEPKKYNLLSGVWGEVVNVSDKNAVLIKTQMRDLNLVAATKSSFAGELLVFPNPTNTLQRFYLENFASGDADGKIVYVGDHVTIHFLKDAIRYGIGGVIGGSADRETFKYAVDAGLSFGLFSGFGNISTPAEVYEILNNVSNRFVFFQGERNLVRIPVPSEENILSIEPKITTPLVEIQKGMRVLTLQRPYFGQTAVVDRVSGSSIFVKFGTNESPVEIFVPNFFVLQSA